MFNASYITESGKSSNDCLYAGPELQVVFTVDIVEIYRQVLVDPCDIDWQKILWRLSPSDKMREFPLQTVINGTKCIPFSALRTLIQLAKDKHLNFTLSAQNILKTSYVDYFLAG